MRRRSGTTGNGYINCTHFYNAIQKYEWDNFEHIVLIENLSLEMANIIEDELIKKYNTMNSLYGYNMVSGGKNIRRRQEVTDKIAEKNRHPSKETLRKMSLASTGRKHSDEVIEKIRKSNTGKKRSEEAKKKMSIAKQNMSEETRRKISEAGKGRKPSELCKQRSREVMTGNKFRAIQIAQYDTDGHFIKVWECAMDVEKECGIDHGNIGKCCNGNAKTAGGFQWRYYYENKNDIEPVGKHKNQSTFYQYDLNKNFIREWESLAEIQKECGYSTPNIIKCCNGDINSAYGYIWSKYELNKRVV